MSVREDAEELYGSFPGGLNGPSSDGSMSRVLAAQLSYPQARLQNGGTLHWPPELIPGVLLSCNIKFGDMRSLTAVGFANEAHGLLTRVFLRLDPGLYLCLLFRRRGLRPSWSGLFVLPSPGTISEPQVSSAPIDLADWTVLAVPWLRPKAFYACANCLELAARRGTMVLSRHTLIATTCLAG
jgi:hypothetical protein